MQEYFKAQVDHGFTQTFNMMQVCQSSGSSLVPLLVVARKAYSFACKEYQVLKPICDQLNWI